MKNRDWLAALSFALAISTRQYMVAFPAAFAAFFTLEALRRRQNAARVIPYAISCLTLLGWFLFFGGFAPAAGRAAHLSMDPGGLHVDHSLYFLSCVGAYFVIVEGLLQRRISFSADRSALAALVAVVCLFILFPPLANQSGVATMGFLDKLLNLALPPIVRIIILALLSILVILRFPLHSTEAWMILLNAAVLLCSHIAWDKYALPLLTALWFLKSRPELNLRQPAL